MKSLGQSGSHSRCDCEQGSLESRPGQASLSDDSPSALGLWERWLPRSRPFQSSGLRLGAIRSRARFRPLPSLSVSLKLCCSGAWLMLPGLPRRDGPDLSSRAPTSFFPASPLCQLPFVSMVTVRGGIGDGGPGRASGRAGGLEGEGCC